MKEWRNCEWKTIVKFDPVALLNIKLKVEFLEWEWFEYLHFN